MDVHDLHLQGSHLYSEIFETNVHRTFICNSLDECALWPSLNSYKNIARNCFFSIVNSINNRSNIIVKIKPIADIEQNLHFKIYNMNILK